MKILKIILLTIAGLLLLLILISFFLPGEVRVERNIIIYTSPSVPFSLVNDLRKWKEWSVWHQYDSNTVYDYSEFSEGEGSWFTWKSKVTGNGKLSITESKPDEYIKTNLVFEDMGINYADFLFEKIGDNSTKVTWIFMSKGEGMPWYFIPASKYFNLFMDKPLGDDFEKGLQALKQICETKTVLNIAGFDAEIKEMPSISYVSIRDTIAINNLSNAYEKMFTELLSALQMQQLKPSGYPFSIIYWVNPKLADIEFALPVSANVQNSDNLSLNQMQPYKALVVKFKGDYNDISTVYKPATDYLQQHNLKYAGKIMEFYITDPQTVTDKSEILTEVIFPIE